MSRPIASAIYVTGTLLVEQPLHVGGAADDVECDLPLARNGKGQICLPGTSVTGALRAWTERRFADQRPLLDAFWGTGPERAKGKASSDEGAASWCWVYDMPVAAGEGPTDTAQQELWHGIGLNRHSGTVEERFKFDQMLLPRGTRLPLRMKIEIPPGDLAASFKALAGWTLSDLGEGRLRLGRGKSSGRGRIRLCQRSLQILEQSRDEAGVNERLKTLLDEPDRSIFDIGQRLDTKSLKTESPSLTPGDIGELQISISWRPVTAVMHKSDQQGIAVDVLPMVSRVSDTEVALVINGSGIRGAFRSQAERIVRTLEQLSVPKPTPEPLADQLQVPLVESLWGAVADKDRRGSASPLHFESLYATNTPVCAEDWDNLYDIKAEHKPKKATVLRQSLDKLGEPEGAPRWEQVYNNVVDRWLSRSINLFSRLEPQGVTWPTIDLTLDLDRLDTHKDAQLAVGLLLLTLQDFAAERIPLGFGVNRGMGSIEVDSIEFRLQGLSNQNTWEWLDTVRLENGRLIGVSEDLMRAWANFWDPKQAEGTLP